MADPATPEAPISAVSRVPNEIWIMIFHKLDFDYAALWAVYATCVTFHQCVQPALFYHLHVHLVENTIIAVNPSDRRIAYHRLWVQFKDVRVLEISDTYTHFDCMTPVTRSLASLMELIPRVKVIKWRSRLEITAGILHMFRFLERPIILDIQGAHEIFLYNITIAPMLEMCPLLNIRSLDINLEHWDQVHHELQMSLFPICSVPTLEALTLTYRAIAPHFRACSIRVPPKARMARLKSLRLYNVYFKDVDGHDWTRCIRGNSLRHLTLDGYFISLMPLRQLAGKVPNLKSLSVRLRNEEDQINEPVDFETMERFLDDATPAVSYMLACFLRSLRSLEEFSGYDLPLAALSDVVQFQGHTIKTLRFRDTFPRETDRGQGTVFLGCKQLMLMATQLPALARLGITMVTGGQTVPMLNYIARFPNLTHLELNTPPKPDPDALVHGARNNNAHPLSPPDPAGCVFLRPIPPMMVKHIFKYIARRKAYYSMVGNNAWPSFDALDMIAREWEPMMAGMRSAFWGLRSTYIYTCRRQIGVPKSLDLSIVSGCGLSLMCVHRYNQTLTATGIWDRRGVYSFDDTNGLECLVD